MVNPQPSRFGTFLAELRRRHVGRIAIAYAAVAFVLLQTGEIVLPAFDAPDWGLRLLVVLVLLGFPVAVALAWVYEITPKGIRRTPELAEERGRPGSMLPRLTFLALTLATAGAAGWWVIRSSVAEQAADGSRQMLAPTAGVPASGAAGEPIRSLAVLPLENFSAQGEQDYFSAGMHEALIYQLSQIEALRVVSRTSVMRYAGTIKSIPEIARELDVQGVIEGSVLRAEGEVRITVQLIDGPSDRHLWSNSYERQLEDIIALQREVAQAIAREIQAELTPEEELRLASTMSVVPEAHEAYLRGRYEQTKGTPAGFEAAVQHYQEAIEIDSAFALALAALAGSSFLLKLDDTSALDEVLVGVVEAAEKALVFDESSPEAQAVLFEVKTRVSSDTDPLSEEHGTLQVRLDTLTLPSGEWLARYTDFGQQVQKLSVSREAHRLNRLPAPRRVAVARRLEAAGEVEQADRILRQVIEEDPGDEEAWDALEHVHIGVGDYEAAVRLRREHAGRPDARPEDAREVVELERAFSEQGTSGYWDWRYTHLEERERRGEPFSQVDFAAAAMALGHYAEALDRLERAFAERDPHLLSLRSDPVWDPIRGQPRFRALVRNIRSIAMPPAPRTK